MDSFFCLHCQRRPVPRLGAKFCSVQCKNAHAYMPSPPKHGTCQHCGQPYLHKTARSRYCSPQCQQQARSARRWVEDAAP